MTSPARLLAFAATLSALLCAATSASAASLSRDEALALAYPDATISAERLFLTKDQVAAAATLGGVAVESPLIARYTARRGGMVIGRAYVDTHTVRTKKESLLISLDASGRMQRVDVVAFLEPPEYQAPTPFADQFTGRSLSDDLQLQRAIRPIAGATLTARAMTDAVRRVLAIDAVLTAADAKGAAR